jgi:hypothetical protein
MQFFALLLVSVVQHRFEMSRQRLCFVQPTSCHSQQGTNYVTVPVTGRQLLGLNSAMERVFQFFTIF